MQIYKLPFTPQKSSNLIEYHLSNPTFKRSKQIHESLVFSFYKKICTSKDLCGFKFLNKCSVRSKGGVITGNVYIPFYNSKYSILKDNKDTELEGVNDNDNKIEGVNNSTNQQQGVSDSNYNSKKQKGVNRTNKQPPFNNRNNDNPFITNDLEEREITIRIDSFKDLSYFYTLLIHVPLPFIFLPDCSLKEVQDCLSVFDCKSIGMCDKGFIICEPYVMNSLGLGFMVDSVIYMKEVVSVLFGFVI